jgi:Bacterial membrane protein YfhO
MLAAILAAAGIVFPALLLSVAVHRWVSPLRVAPVAISIALSLVFVGRGLVPGTITVPVDEVARGYPYAPVVGETHPRNPLTNDTVKLFLPWMQVAREQIFAGRAPLWNRYSFSGYPLLGNGESAPFSPFFLLTLFVPLPKQIVAMAGLKIFVSLLFAYLFAKKEGTSDAAAFLLAIAYAWSVYETVYLYYSAVAVSALLPAELLAVRAVYRERSRRSIALLAIVTAALLAAGHPESVFHVGLGAIFVLGLDVLTDARPWRDRARHTAATIGAALAGFALSAAAWIPVVELMHQSGRYEEIVAAGRDMTPSMPYPAAATLLFPNAFGNPAAGTWSWVLNYSIVASSYVGLLVLALAIAAVVSPQASRRERAYAIAAVSVFLVAMNWTPVAHLLNGLAPLSLVANDKFRFVACFFAATAAALAVDRIRDRSFALELVASAGVGIVVLLLYRAKAGSTLGPGELAGLAALVVFWGAMLLARQKAGAAAAALVAAELLVLNLGFNAPAAERFYRPRLPIIEALKKDSPGEPFRMLCREWVLMPNASAQYGLEDIRGSDPMAWAPYIRLFGLIEVHDPNFDVKRVADVEQPLLDFLNVRYLLAEPGAVGESARWQLVYRAADGDLFRNRRLIPRFFIPGMLIGCVPGGELSAVRSIDDFSRAVVVSSVGPGERQANASGTVQVRSTETQLFRLAVDAKGPTFIASSEPALAGWRVRVNGRRVKSTVVNGAFLGFAVPAGHSKVEVSFAPVSFYASAAVSLVVAVAIAISLRRRQFDS